MYCCTTAGQLPTARSSFRTSSYPRVFILCPAASNVFRNAPNSCAVDPAWSCSPLMMLSKYCPRCGFVICCLNCRWRCSAYLSSAWIWRTPGWLAILGFNSLTSGCNRVTPEQPAVSGFNSSTSSCDRTASDGLLKCCRSGVSRILSPNVARYPHSIGLACVQFLGRGLFRRSLGSGIRDCSFLWWLAV